jgi:hypothetical protein
VVLDALGAAGGRVVQANRAAEEDVDAHARRRAVDVEPAGDRPWLYGLAAGGEAGVAGVLEILRAEIDRALALLGRPRFDDVDATALGALTTTTIPGTP